jgi:ribosomal protein L29
MIEARHAAWADRIFDPYVTWLFRRHFEAIHLLGQRPKTDPALPLLLLPNHSSWWDGFFVYLLNKKIFARRPYLLMLEEQLSRYRFFARLGVFSINPNSTSSVRSSLRRAATILREPSSPRRLLCIFPQGELWPWAKRPLGYKRGAELIMRAYGGKLNILPLAIKIEFLNDQRPHVFFLFGENRLADHHNFPTMIFIQAIEAQLLDELARRLLNGERGTVLIGRKRANRNDSEPT